jgi:hypothetical protein
LPQHDYNSKYADAGTEHHADMEAAIDVGDEDAIPAEILSLIQPGDETITEMAYAWDPTTDTARELGRITREQYAAALRPGELPGKSDLVIRGNDRIAVVDHKGFEEVDDAERNRQLATYALMVTRTYGYDECDVVIKYRAPWRRPSYATLNALDLAAHADRLVALRANIEKARETPQLFLNDGAHCRYCPAFLGGCPRQETLARQVRTGEMERRAADLMPFANDDEAALALDLRDRLKMLLSRLEAGLHARAAVMPIPRGDGRVWGPREKEGKRKIDGAKARELLAQRFGAKIAEESVRYTVAQKWIEDALKSNGVKGAAGKVKSLVAELEEAGAVERPKSVVFEEYDATLALKDAV